VAGEIIQFQSAYRTYLLLRVIHVQLELVLIVRPVGETRRTSLLLIAYIFIEHIRCHV
jgi:hypothetical protein